MVRNFKAMSAIAGIFVFCSSGVFGAPETLVLRNHAGTSTVEVEINYDKLPKVPPPAGYQWSDFFQDTAWTEPSRYYEGYMVPYVRYNRLFRARWNGMEGLGYDYVHFDGIGSGNDHYHGLFGFTFQEGNMYWQFEADGPHYRENPKLPVPSNVLVPGSPDNVNFYMAELNPWKWLGGDAYLFIERRQGWGNGSGGNPHDGEDIPADRNGRMGAPPRGLFYLMR